MQSGLLPSSGAHKGCGRVLHKYIFSIFQVSSLKLLTIVNAALVRVFVSGWCQGIVRTLALHGNYKPRRLLIEERRMHVMFLLGKVDIIV
jgi:hypothetical protein